MNLYETNGFRFVFLTNLSSQTPVEIESLFSVCVCVWVFCFYGLLLCLFLRICKRYAKTPNGWNHATPAKTFPESKIISCLF